MTAATPGWLRALAALIDLMRAGGGGVAPRRPQPDVLQCRVRVAVQQRLRCHDHPRRAEAALHAARIDERLLHGGQVAGAPAPPPPPAPPPGPAPPRPP